MSTSGHSLNASTMTGRVQIQHSVSHEEEDTHLGAQPWREHYDRHGANPADNGQDSRLAEAEHPVRNAPREVPTEDQEKLRQPQRRAHHCWPDIKKLKKKLKK